MEENTTVGAFLKEKASNMVEWLIEEKVLTKRITVTELTTTTMATKLEVNRQIVYNRDWSGIARLAGSAGLTDLTQMIEAVRSRQDLHDKFWRYLELFVDTLTSH